MNKISIIFFCLLLGACSLKATIGPNAKKHIETSIRSSVVDVYSRNEIWKLKAVNLGLVETDFCQTNKYEGLPPQSALYKILKSKTQKLGGNGIVYESCKTGRTYMNCELYMRCQATAYKIDYKSI